MVAVLIYLLVFCLVFWMLYYIVNNLAPEPFRRVLNVVLLVVGVIALIFFLLDWVLPLLSSGATSFGPHRLR